MPFYSHVHLNKNTIQGTYLLKWKYGTRVLAKYDTCYDSDNELDFDDPNYEDFMSFIVRIKKLNSFDSRDGFKKEWLKEVNSQSLISSIGHLDWAFNRFFKGLGGFPKFKKKELTAKSFEVP